MSPPTPIAFLSYAHRDDDAYGGKISDLRIYLQKLVGSAIGRDFEIFQDVDGIAWGRNWRDRLDDALTHAHMLIPILTPSFFNSEFCIDEVEKFLEMQRRSGRTLILPIYFRTAPVLERRQTPLAVAIADLQYRDLREFRHLPLQSLEVSRTLDLLADEIAAAAEAMMSEAERESEVETTNEGEQADVLQPLQIFRDVDEPWCPELVVIPAGEFIMGAPKEEVGSSDRERPQHRVTFARPFALGRYPVTFEQFDAFCIATGRKKPDTPLFGGRERDHPVVNVSWDDAAAYCAWLIDRSGHAYRLPSEADWEYATRAGTTTPFWTGDTISTDQANYNGNYTYGSGRKGEYRFEATPVGTFDPNAWGLYDVHGNIYEWIADCWNESYEDAPVDGSAWKTGNCYRRVLRGGMWSLGPRCIRSAFRIQNSAAARFYYVGFRVARTLTL